MSAGVKSRNNKDKRLSKKGLDMKSKVNSDELEEKTTSEHKEDIIKSLVFNHMKKVAPNLAKEFSSQ